MSFEPPIPISIDFFKYYVTDIEAYLRGTDFLVRGKEYPPKYYETSKGEKIVIRQATVDEADVILQPLKEIMDLGFDKDFYHLVAARTYSEILAWKQRRVKDHVALVAVHGNELQALVNFRLWNEKLAISLHTITFRRKERLGIVSYTAKVEHAFEVLGVDEWWATFESPFGFRMGFRLVHGMKPYPEYQHELGGGRVFYITRRDWDAYVKAKVEKYLGSRPVPEDLYKESLNLKPPERLEIEL
jgi:hypothetical protein